MRITSLRIDAALLSFGALGLACGPSAPDATSDDSSTGTPDTTNTTELTTGEIPTTGTPPECVEDGDCDPECGYCSEGRCGYRPCCGSYGGPGCGECNEGDGCYCFVDDECPGDEICVGMTCTPRPPPNEPLLLECTPIPFDTSTWNLTARPHALALADFDGDGDLDIASAHPAEARLDLSFNNNGLGTFEPGPQVMLADPPDSYRLAAADLDDDADIDLVLARTSPGDLQVLLNDGAGMFMPGASQTTTSAIDVLFIARIDADPTLDVVGIDAASGAVTQFLGDGMGALLPEQPCADITANNGSVITDVDGDGRADVVATPPGEGLNLMVSVTNADASCAPSQLLKAFGGIHGAQATDLDGDGAVDILATRQTDTGGAVNVFIASQPGVWSDPVGFATASPLHGSVFADLDSDGIPDLISATGEDRVAALLGDGEGFACEQVLPAPSATTRVELLATGDLDGDGKLDLVIATRDSTTVHTLRQQ